MHTLTYTKYKTCNTIQYIQYNTYISEEIIVIISIIKELLIVHVKMEKKKKGRIEVPGIVSKKKIMNLAGGICLC